MKKMFSMPLFFLFTALAAHAQLIKNDFLAGIEIGSAIEKGEYREAVTGRSENPIRINQWNLTRVANERNGSSPVAVPPLEYAGYADSGKDPALKLSALPDGGRITVYSLADNQTYGPGTYYLSFMIDVSSVVTNVREVISFDSDYLGGTLRARFAIKGINKKTFQMGLNGTNTVVNAQFADQTYPFGTTHLVVLKAEFDASGTGICSLYVDPDLSGDEPQPSLTTPLNDMKQIRGISVRQRPLLDAQIGGIRFSKSWAGILNQ